MASSMCQLDSSCEMPSMPLDDLRYHRQPPLSPCQYNLVVYIVLCFPLGKIYTSYLCIITFSFPLVCLIFLVMYLTEAVKLPAYVNTLVCYLVCTTSYDC